MRCLRGVATGLVALAFALRSAAAMAADAPLPVQPVAPGVYVHFGEQAEWAPASHGDIANLGFVVGERCVAVIDTGGTPAVGERLRAAVEATTRLPVCFVIDTHMHQDHVLGNVAFAALQPRPEFVPHAKLPAALAARERFFLHALERDFHVAMTHEQVVYPTRTVGDTLALDLGGRRLLLKAWPTAHTDNDLTVLDEKTGTLFLSDLLFVGHLPVLDGKLAGWLAALEQLRDLPATLAVPGHGPASRDWPGVLEPERRYLAALRDETRAAIRKKMTIQQATDVVAKDAARPWLLVDQYHKRNVTAAYAELEWEE